MKQNCWEFKKCGREAGGCNAGELGVCPAAMANPLHGSHGGNKGGRACWIVAGTMCSGVVQGSFAQKFRGCTVCDFYQTVKSEEQSAFQFSTVLLGQLNGSSCESDR